MRRPGKKIRAKWFLPRTQIRNRDAETNQSSIVGQHDQSFFDDKALDFVDTQTYYPSKLPTQLSGSINDILTSSLVVSGIVRAGVSDVFLGQTSGEQTGGLLTPFRDNGNPAVDGLSQGNTGFYAGVASLEKFEVNIPGNGNQFTYVISQSVKTDDVPKLRFEESHPMAYYNFDTQDWEGIGPGWAMQAWYPVSSGSWDRAQQLHWSTDYATIGFSPSIITCQGGTMFGSYDHVPSNITGSNATIVSAAVALLSRNYAHGAAQKQCVAGQPTTRYGFPHHAKFHATGSQLLDLRTKINRPFKLEKLVVELSGVSFKVYDSVTSDDSSQYNLTSSILPATINNFFILTQRECKKLLVSSSLVSWPDYTEVWQLPKQVALVAPEPEQSPELATVSTIRELVTWGGITSHTADIDEDFTHDLIFPSKEIYDDIMQRLDPSNINFQYVTGYQTNDTSLPFPYLSESLTCSVTPLQNMIRDTVVSSSESISSSVEFLGWDADSIIMELEPRVPHQWQYGVSGPQKFNWGTSDYVGVFEKGGRSGLGLAYLDREGTVPLTSARPKILPGTSGSLTDFDISTITPFGANVPIYTEQLGSVPKSPLTSFYPGYFVGPGITEVSLAIPEEGDTYQVKPYVLYPDDKLIIGWQLPTLDSVRSMNINRYNNWVRLSVPQTLDDETLVDICAISFDGPAKITFYGTYLENGEENRDNPDQYGSVRTHTDSVAVTTTIIGEEGGWLK